MPFTLAEKPDGLVFRVRVQPRSSANRIAGLVGDAIKINLTAPPVDNAANRACIVFLARRLSVPKTAVTIVSGHTGRNKRVMIHCTAADSRRAAVKAAVLGWANTQGGPADQRS